MRRTIGERLQASYQIAPHITFTARADMSAFGALRRQLNDYAKTHQEPTVSVTLAGEDLGLDTDPSPLLNSSLRGDEIHLFKNVHLGVAVALPDGLIVPVVHDAARKSAGQLAREVSDLAERARQGRLLPADVAGGTFTLSNLGPFGIGAVHRHH